MKSRRCMCPRKDHVFAMLNHNSYDRAVCEKWRTTGSDADQTQWPLWVISGHFAAQTLCPLYPQKQTLIGATRLSALCQ
jgi:hypothetical protein